MKLGSKWLLYMKFSNMQWQASKIQKKSENVKLTVIKCEGIVKSKYTVRANIKRTIKYGIWNTLRILREQ